MTTAAHEELARATGYYMDGTEKKPVAVAVPVNNAGKDDAMSLSVKQKNFDANREKNIKMLMEHRKMPRQAAEQLQDQMNPKKAGGR